MSHVLGHLLGLLLLAAAVYLPGHALEKTRPLGDLDLRPLARWIYGLAWWSVGLFLPATFGALGPVGLASWAGFSLAASAGLLIQARRRSTVTSEPRRADLRWTALGWGLLVLVALPLFLIALGPTRSWDAEVYHLSLPELYVAHGGFRVVDMNVYSNWPLGVELFFAAALVLQDFVTAKLVHWGFGLLVLLALTRKLGRGAASVAWGLAASLLFLANDVVLFEMRVAYVDLALTFYLLCLFFFLDRAANEPRDTRSPYLWLAGLAAGLAAGVKITGIAYAGLVGLIYAPRLWKDLRRDHRLAIRDLVPLALPTTLLAALWPLKAAWATGNPFYPLFWNLLGGPDWSPRLAEQFSTWQQGIGMGREPLDYLLLPLRVILLGDHGYDTFDGKIGSFWLVALPLAVWAAWTSPTARRALGAAFALAVFWAASSQQMRFLIPVLALIAWALVRGLRDRLTAGLEARHRLARATPHMATVVGLALLLTATDYLSLVRTAGRYAQIFVSPQFAQSSLDAAAPPVQAAVDALPPDAKLLLLRTNRRFGLRRELLADSFFEASQISDWLADAEDPQAVADALDRRGVTHVLIHLDRPERPMPYPEPLLALVSDPDRVQPVHRDDHHLLLALR